MKGVRLPGCPPITKKEKGMNIEEQLAELRQTASRIERMMGTLLGENKPRTDPQRFMNIEQASKATGLSMVSLREYCNRGEIRSTKIGKRLIIHTDSLYRYIEEKARKTTAEKAGELLASLGGVEGMGFKTQER